MNTLPLRSFRLVCKQKHIPQVEELLRVQGFIFTPEPFHPYARKLLHEPFSLGSSLAARFGYIYIQDRSSMLPPVVLTPPAGSAVLDMCASPGSKTGFLAQLLGSQGFVLGNEPSPQRLATLRYNLGHLGLLQSATTSYAAELFPACPQGHPGWPFILLDPPCSGWGTVHKNAQVLNLWHGNKVDPLVALQRTLLRHAHSLLRVGGQLVYSTCTTNPAENEEQILFAVEQLGFRLLPISPPAGFALPQAAQPSGHGTIHIPTSKEEQGFFIALLEKQQAEDPSDSTSASSQQAAKRKAAHKRHWLDAGLPLKREGLGEAGLCLDALPPGDIRVYNGTAHLLHEHATALLAQECTWKGFPLGKVQGGQLHFSPWLHTLMADSSVAKGQGCPILNTDDTQCIEKLLTGQSIPVPATPTRHKYMNLYFADLPLCRLHIKGNRAILPAR